jgi:hypothetical protein
MKYKILFLSLLLIFYSTVVADINGVEPDDGCTRVPMNTEQFCIDELNFCLGQIIVPIFYYDPSVHQLMLNCYEEAQYCMDSYIENCEPDPDVPPPPPEEPPPGWDSPVTVDTGVPNVFPSPVSSSIPAQ